MTTSSGHTSAILASKVKGTAVYNDAGDKLGTVEDVVLDKQSNQIMFAALVQTQAGFIILYLLVHGALKMAITITLLRGRGVWIFPFSSVILLGFIAYMSYELSIHWSYLLLALALLDTVTLALVLNEWRTWKEHPHPAIKELKEELTPHH